MAAFLFFLILLIALMPLLIRIGRVLLIAHMWLVALFLPGGLLVRYGPSQDTRLFIGVTCAWALALVAYRFSPRARARGAAARRNTDVR